MKNKKYEFPTKEEVIKALLDDKELKGFKKYMLVLEYKKISEGLGLIKAELIHNNKAVLRGKMTEFPETTSESFEWDKLRAGQSYFVGFSLDYTEETFVQGVINGIKKSMKEGRIPFLPK
ncbi:MAG: hypothetical protein NT130_04530 [Candidatus Micrarchaeota archaeon]|nr:hypothetical protein [Candidatus Micrarchaeota archaeon]